MEKLILSKKNNFRVSTARFANVAFSNGSLLDGFNFRLNKKQPLSCPSDIKRFFVTHEQSGQICLLATFLGDTGDIFPKLDFHQDQIYFKEIALDYLKDKGFEPVLMYSEKEAKEYEINNSGRYPIYFFKTDTSGEKGYEEFYSGHEKLNLNKYNSVGCITTDDIEISFQDVVDDFNKVFNEKNINKASVIKVLKEYVPDFSHIETGKNLDQKM